MERDESILGKAKTRIGAKRTERKAIDLITEHLFNTEVKPLLEQIGTDFLERKLSPIFFLLMEEAKELIEEKEKGLSVQGPLEFVQDIFYFYKKGDLFDDVEVERESFTLSDIMEDGKKEERKKLLDLLEDGVLLEKLGVAVHVKLSGPYKDNHDYTINVDLNCYDNNNDWFYSNRLTVRVGEKSWSAKTNSEKEMNELIEKVVLALDSQKYSSPKYIAKTKLFLISSRFRYEEHYKRKKE